jgi:hypothetical protein
VGEGGEGGRGGKGGEMTQIMYAYVKIIIIKKSFPVKSVVKSVL